MKSSPASRNQLQFWLVSRMFERDPANNIPCLLEISGQVQVDLLVRSVQESLDSCALFSSQLRKGKMGLEQCYDPKARPVVERQVWGQAGNEEIEERFQRFSREIINQPLDVTGGPLVRAILVEGGRKLWLILLFHHALVDLHTKVLLERRISETYSLLIKGQAPEQPGLPPVENTYTDYSHYSQWQREWLQGEKGERQIGFWQKTLAERKKVLDFPTDGDPRVHATLAGGGHFFDLDPGLCARVSAYCTAHTVDPFVFFLATYYLLLARYSGQADITVGVPFSNRREERFKDTWGCMMNILPIGVDQDEKMTFPELLVAVRKALLLGHRNQEIPIDVIVEQTIQQRESNRNPLFQQGFTFEPPMQLELPGAEVKSLRSRLNASRLDLFLTMWEEEDHYAGEFTYSSEVFSPVSARRITETYRTLVGSVLVADDQPLAMIPALSDLDLDQIARWNDTSCPYSDDTSIHQVLERQVQEFGERPAITFGKTSLTYSELNQRANQLAHLLIKRGVAPGARVGIFLERSLDLLVGIYGILKAGATYVPLGVQYPEQRLSYMLDDAEINLVITASTYELKAEGAEFKRVEMDQIDWGGEHPNPNLETSAKDTTYILYTSGSTGQPKGVAIQHFSVLNRIEWMQKKIPIGPGDVILHKTPVTFDISVYELFWWSFSGAAVHFLAPGQEASPAAILAEIEMGRVTIMNFVASMLHVFLEYLEEEEIQQLTSLRYLITCGEPLQLSDARQWQEKLGRTRGIPLHNMYGPTETTVDSATYKFAPDQYPDRVPIGSPIDNTKLYIVDGQGQILPIGARGELLIEGAGLGKGYINKPELTARAFIPNHLNPEADRLYRTGDLARYFEDGEIDCLGRLDHQVKIRGHRIELDEIEGALEKDELVEEAVVLPTGPAGQQDLTAFLVLSQPEKGEIELQDKTARVLPPDQSSALRSRLRQNLPEYMLPARFGILAQFPRLPNSKIDRKTLRELPLKTSGSSRIQAIPPKTDMEKELFSHWSEMLGRDDFGIRDNFFDIGGNSLLVLELATRLKGKDLDMVVFFQYPSISMLAEYLSEENEPESRGKELADRAEKQRIARANRKKRRRKR